MDIKHVVVDRSDIATEGRSLPSLAQLDEAVRAFLEENPTEQLTVIVDATFGHRIDPSEKDNFEAALAANELITPPAGAIGRGDAFVLQIANRADAVILSNDSFQEFHGQYTWLFDEGRLVGGKPVPGVGWVFLLRTPVRGPASRRSVREAKSGPNVRGVRAATPSPARGRGRDAQSDGAGGDGRSSRSRRSGAKSGSSRAPAAVATASAGSGSGSASGSGRNDRPRRKSRRRADQRAARLHRVRRKPPGRLDRRGHHRSVRVARRVRRGIRRSLLRAAQGDGRSRTQEHARRRVRRRDLVVHRLVVRHATTRHRRRPRPRLAARSIARRRCRRRRLEHRHADALDHRWSRHTSITQRPTTDAPIDPRTSTTPPHRHAAAQRKPTHRLPPLVQLQQVNTTPRRRR